MSFGGVIVLVRSLLPYVAYLLTITKPLLRTPLPLYHLAVILLAARPLRSAPLVAEVYYTLEL